MTIQGIGAAPKWGKVLLRVPANDPGPEGEEKISKTSPNDAFAGYLSAIAENSDKRAYKRLFDHFAPRVKTYLLGLKVSEARADDLVQEVFLTIWRKAGLYNADKAYVSTWIFTIARNRFIDEKRKQKRFPADALQYEEELREVETGEKKLAEKQTVKRIREVLGTLPQSQRMVIEKTFLEGKSHAEVAEETGLALGTVKSRIRLGFGKMRNQLEVNQ